MISRRSFVSSAAACAALVGCRGAIPSGSGCEFSGPSDDQGQFGSLLDITEFSGSPQAIAPWAFDTPPVIDSPPSSWTLTNLPSVAMQGTPAHLGAPGSCEAQSFGYGLGSYTAARLPDGTPKWDPQNPINQASAAYQYRLEHFREQKTCPSGSLAIPYLDRLIAVGSPTAAQVPYVADCCYIDSIPLGISASGALRLGSFAVFNIADALMHETQAQVLAFMKHLIFRGFAIAFSGEVPAGYAKPSADIHNNVYYPPDSAAGGHGQLIVGYDDNAGDASRGLGAFYVQNSFGTQWPAPPAQPPGGGRVLYSYDGFFKFQKLAAVAYSLSGTPPSGTPLSPSDPSGPQTTIARAFQWGPNASDAFLILVHNFAQPVALTNVILTEPGPSPKTATAVYRHNIAEGYTYLKRADGNAFRSGTYNVTLQSSIPASGEGIITLVNYAGTITVPTLSGRTEAGMVAPITGTTGATAPLS